MKILFDSKPRVKPSRKPFGAGLGPKATERFRGPTADDLAWAAYHLNVEARDYDVVLTAEDREWDRLAEEAEHLDRVQRGFVGC